MFHAEQDYQAVLKGEQATGWYALDTEGGPDPQVPTCNGPTGTTSGCPTDDILPGSAGYSNVSMAFIQTLTQLFDNHSPRINWVWWPGGTWTDTPCAGTYGALQSADCPAGTGYKGGVGWGNLLNFIPVSGTAPRFPLLAHFTFGSVPVAPSTNITFNAVATGGLSPYRLNWSFGDGGTASGSSVNHAYSSVGRYNVTLSVMDWMNRTSTTFQALTVRAQSPDGQGVSGGICQVLCLFIPLLPTLLAITIGTVYWFTVSGLNLTRSRFSGRLTVCLGEQYGYWKRQN